MRPPLQYHPAAAPTWQARSAACIEAAVRLEEHGGLGWPRAQVLSRALECSLKAYLCRARGGAPDSQDLGHLLRLALLCGLTLTDDDQACLTAVAAWCRAAEVSMAVGDPPAASWVGQVCRTIVPHAAT